MELKDYVRSIPDFPKPGILFRDITPLLGNKDAFQEMVNRMADFLRDKNIDLIIAPEARGFIFSASVAYALNVGMVLARKPGKLPYTTVSYQYGLEYGTDEVFLYEDQELSYFRAEPYTAMLEDFIRAIKPSVVLVGGTITGRSLAPRAAARFHTGLTADCTVLDITESTDLDQIRPAYGGNIMAHIRTPRHRPQFATVRYKIFPIPPKCTPNGKVTRRALSKDALATAIEILSVTPKAQESGIEDAEVIVAGGRGLKKPEDLAMLQELAGLLNGRVASSRALVEAGWTDPRQQIGLSGRTVKPKLLIACGISGAIQFVAGMSGAEQIIAINTDPKAPIFKVAHVAITGDLYEIVPQLIEAIKKHKARA